MTIEQRAEKLLKENKSTIELYTASRFVEYYAYLGAIIDCTMKIEYYYKLGKIDMVIEFRETKDYLNRKYEAHCVENKKKYTL